jgi:hypothetical protein
MASKPTTSKAGMAADAMAATAEPATAMAPTTERRRADGRERYFPTLTSAASAIIDLHNMVVLLFQ